MTWTREDAHEAKIKKLTQRIEALEVQLKARPVLLIPEPTLSQEDVERLKEVVQCITDEARAPWSDWQRTGVRERLSEHAKTAREILGMGDA